jgi:hypothetical protein
MGPNYFKNLKRIDNELVVLQLGIWIFFQKFENRDYIAQLGL